MKILVRYFFDVQQSEILEIEVDETASFANITQLVSNLVQNNVLLLPIKAEAIQSIRTIKEYCQKIQSNSREFYFTAVK